MHWEEGAREQVCGAQLPDRLNHNDFKFLRSVSVETGVVWDSVAVVFGKFVLTRENKDRQAYIQTRRSRP